MSNPAKVAKAFNEGSDARIAGVRLAHNPYDAMKEPVLRYTWASGWRDVARWWGRESKTKVKALPVVNMNGVSSS